MTSYYGDVDSAYLEYVGSLLGQLKQRTYALMQLRPGAAVLDVGCGPGIDTVALAELVGDAGRVVGVDANAAFVAQADERVRAAGLGARVDHRVADAGTLPFADGSFDACRSERLLQHLQHPGQAIAEMVRVTRPGGWVVALDTDWGTLSVDVPEVDVERRLARFEADSHNNGYSGRRLLGLFRQYGLTDITVECSAMALTRFAVADEALGLAQTAEVAVERGAITADEARRWIESLARADAEGRFFASVGGVLAAGRKPE